MDQRDHDFFSKVGEDKEELASSPVQKLAYVKNHIYFSQRCGYGVKEHFFINMDSFT